MGPHSSLVRAVVQAGGSWPRGRMLWVSPWLEDSSRTLVGSAVRRLQASIHFSFACAIGGHWTNPGFIDLARLGGINWSAWCLVDENIVEKGRASGLADSSSRPSLRGLNVVGLTACRSTASLSTFPTLISSKIVCNSFRKTFNAGISSVLYILIKCCWWYSTEDTTISAQRLFESVTYTYRYWSFSSTFRYIDAYDTFRARESCISLAISLHLLQGRQTDRVHLIPWGSSRWRNSTDHLVAGLAET